MNLPVSEMQKQLAAITTIEEGITVEARANKLRDAFILAENVEEANKFARICCEASVVVGEMLGVDTVPGKHDATQADVGRQQRVNYRNMARVSLEERLNYYDAAQNDCEIISKAGVIRLYKSAHVSHNSGEHEWYTPTRFIESARKVMGSIDLDPATSELAQETVKAGIYYTVEHNGLDQEWSGNIWMNPPYQAGLIDRFIVKLDTSDIKSSIVLVNNSTDTEWFDLLMTKSCAACFPKGRIKFLDKCGNKGAPLQGQAIVYRGENPDSFCNEYRKYGNVLMKY